MAAPPPTSFLVLTTDLGRITLRFLADRAPVTAAHIAALVRAGLYDGGCFHRSDFVIQCGVRGGAKNLFPALAVNESARTSSNARFTASVAHWDVPDNGNSEFFINLQDNPHLDSAYGGYAVFASVDSADAESARTVAAVSAAILKGTKPVILKAEAL